MAEPQTMTRAEITYDLECRQLCRALNAITPAVQTIESCSGHGAAPLRIALQVDDLAALPAVLYWLDACLSGESGWRCLVYTDCAADMVRWLIEGPAERANHLAAAIESSLPQRSRRLTPWQAGPPAPFTKRRADGTEGGR